MQELAIRSGRGALPTIPGVQALSQAIRYLPGGRASFLEFIQAAVLNGDQACAAWYAIFAQLSNYEQQRVSLDDVCAGSGIGPAALLRGVVTWAIDHNTDLGNLMTAVLHPRVVHAAGKSALRIGGKFADIAQKDRFALLTHSKFLPIPKGSTTNVNVNAAAGANATAAAAAAANPSVPSFKDDMRSLHGAKSTVQTALSTEPMPDRTVDGEIADDDGDE